MLRLSKAEKGGFEPPVPLARPGLLKDGLTPCYREDIRGELQLIIVGTRL